MRYWVHATLTILLSVVGVVAGLDLHGRRRDFAPFDAPAWVGHVVIIVGLACRSVSADCGDDRIPCACPKCGGRAKYGFAAWGKLVYTHVCVVLPRRVGGLPIAGPRINRHSVPGGSR